MRRSTWCAGLAATGVGVLAVAAGCGDMESRTARPAAPLPAAASPSADCGVGAREPPRTVCVPVHALLNRTPYMGVSCPEPNSIACDRVGLDLELSRPAERVSATIAGRRLSLRPLARPGEPRTHWQGFLRPAGLLDGPLEVIPDRGRHHWRGEHPVVASVRITVERRDGTTQVARLRQRLAAGWG